ncbi:class I SAM-dependent methyltransferase [Streptomyces uncialis]|uniref:class I SAM-dependent methyltransferase n=1 Tax=Streptomyces uncialis TaxID=1048205 RepID=UPI0022570116|nr:class I SAM-dependent methyltransferase [Streptomyces uncialis]MCX4664062.1 class I SAM-dependent methyltransferase [Streptomyces uncialis]WST70265.1 class I SAM-dependent methyltransferase [Streptomyces uncialis]WTE11088.1 class I SAM-dependent methyltransferase [Streptomyces uncialis]
MSTGQGERWDRWAPYYDQDTAGQNVQPVAAGLARLAGAGPVLELGIGTGRVAFALAEWGVAVTGIDTSPQMIEQLEERADQGPPRSPVRAVRGDMAGFDLGELFPLVYVSVSTIFLLTSQEEQVACFRSAARHLRPGGRFVVEAAVPHTSGLAAEREQMIVREMGDDHLKWSAFLHDPATQTVRAQEVRVGPDGFRMLPNLMRYAHPGELDLMAQLAGLRLERRLADWSGRAFSAASTHHVSVYSRVPDDPALSTGGPA